MSTGALSGSPPSSRVLGWVGVGLIWACLSLFLVLPLCRIFYDAVTNESVAWGSSASGGSVPGVRAW